MPDVFFSYSHADEELRDQLETHLAALKRQQVIETWHDRRIVAGEDFSRAIDEHVNTAQVVLLLVSPDFIASDYCYNIEMKQAMRRHESGDAVVIPVILRPCEWQGTPFGKLLAVPRDGKPVTRWPDRDEALLQVAKAVREAASRFDEQKFDAAPSTPPFALPAATAAAAASGPRSSNLRLAKTFSQRDKDRFKHESFEFIAKFFENSLAELAQRNPGYEGLFRRVDQSRFYATVYRDGSAVARATIFMGGGAFSDGINFAHGEISQSNQMNESLSIDVDDQSLFLTAAGFSSAMGDRKKKLSQEGAAEYFWDIVIGPLQQRVGR